MSFRETETFDIAGPAGRLEAILNLPAEGIKVRAAAVICHAHPLHGGMMHFKVIFRAAKSLQSHGIAVLRFNFRGVGRSEGVHDQGIGEQADARAALSEMEQRFPGAPLILGGFSFGSAMAAKVAATDPRVKAVLVLGFPITRIGNTADLAHLHQPTLFVQGSDDEFGPGYSIRKVVGALQGEHKLEVVEGADHFFTGRLDELQASIDAWASTAPWENS
ncbi:MAG: alpha/beta fold hydrolase [Vicinamibacteria bacterium]|jgi:alpha/beta superfamily hydrolase|nr:alpha/beta fold hydrolase [Vicinamibacteria bacterium]